MENGENVDFGDLFAQLTCLLEDAAGTASEGQSARLNAASRVRLVGVLDNALQEASGVLKEIKTGLHR